MQTLQQAIDALPEAERRRRRDSLARERRERRAKREVAIPTVADELDQQHSQPCEVRAYVRAFNRLNHLRDTLFEMERVAVWEEAA